MGTIATYKELINTDCITSIEVRPKKIHFHYRWNEAIHFLYIPFIIWRKAGFYDYMDDYVNLDNLDKDDNYYVENKWVYYKPHIVLNLNDRSERRIYFDSVELMDEYVTQFKSKNINFFYL